MSDIDATHVRHDVAAEVDEILENVINANMLCMPYDVYFELFDAVAGLGVKVEKIESENAKLRELVRDMACEYECGYLTLPQWLADRMRELGVDE